MTGLDSAQKKEIQRIQCQIFLSTRSAFYVTYYHIVTHAVR